MAKLVEVGTKYTPEDILLFNQKDDALKQKQKALKKIKRRYLIRKAIRKALTKARLSLIEMISARCSPVQQIFMKVQLMMKSVTRFKQS